MLYLVRHAKAGSRQEWRGDDRLRPLSKPGRRQADTLARRLARFADGELVSSPYERCQETLAPLASVVRLPIRLDERLAEAAPFEGMLALLAEVPDGTIVCSHGDVIPDTIAALERRGCAFTGEPQWGKGSVWVLERDGEGNVIAASAWPPPED